MPFCIPALLRLIPCVTASLRENTLPVSESAAIGVIWGRSGVTSGFRNYLLDDPHEGVVALCHGTTFANRPGGKFYHVLNRGNERRAIFRDDQDREGFLDRRGRCSERFSLDVYAYVLRGTSKPAGRTASTCGGEPVAGGLERAGMSGRSADSGSVRGKKQGRSGEEAGSHLDLGIICLTIRMKAW